MLRLMHYLDDFLVFGDSEAAVATKVAEFKEVLASAGFLISDKSSSRPERELVARPIAHVQWGAKWMTRPPTNLLRSLSGALWFAGRGWWPPTLPPPAPKGAVPAGVLRRGAGRK